MKLRAPAKVNLHLRILGRRPDGFHELETLIVPVSLADEITVETSLGRTVRIVCDHPEVPQGENNLAAMAAHAFSRHTGLQFAARIEIQKRIPLGAGLGGGSSDAAAVLIALDSIFETHLDTVDLERIGAGLGSDVPFFVRRQPALCRGRGDIIERAECPEPLPLLLIKPPFGIETPWAYKAWAASRALPGGSGEEQDLGWTRIFNSLERPAFEKFLVLPVLKHWLVQQPEVRAAAMSGSGSTLFAILREKGASVALTERIRDGFGPSFWIEPCEAPA